MWDGQTRTASLCSVQKSGQTSSTPKIMKCCRVLYITLSAVALCENHRANPCAACAGYVRAIQSTNQTRRGPINTKILGTRNKLPRRGEETCKRSRAAASGTQVEKRKNTPARKRVHIAGQQRYQRIAIPQYFGNVLGFRARIGQHCSERPQQSAGVHAEIFYSCLSRPVHPPGRRAQRVVCQRAAQDNIETPHTTRGRQKGREAAAV